MQETPETTPQPQIDQFELEIRIRRLKEEQNIGLGIIGGLVGMGVGAVIWALITVITEYQLGLIAIGVGILAGLGVRYLGKGFDTIYGIVGAVTALFGIVIGNVLTIVVFIAQEFDVTYMEVVQALDVTVIVEAMRLTFAPIDLLFYALAIYYGYRYAMRRLTPKELSKPTSNQPV
jgi:hypothetical protein